MVIEHSVGSAHHGFPASARIPRHADSRLNIVRVRLNTFLQAKVVISGLSEPGRRLEGRRNLDVVSDPVVQCDGGAYAPGILPECANGNVPERITRAANTLDEILWQAGAVSLDRRERREVRQNARSRVNKSETRCREAPEVVYTAIVHRENSIKREIVKVCSELGVVTANRPRESVGELIPLFCTLNVGVRFATEVGKAGNIYRRVGAAGNGGVVEVGEATAGILKQELVDLVRTDRPGILRNSFDVAEGLLRGARVGVLPKGLVLSANLNSSDCAGTHLAANHKAIVVADVVVEAKRVDAGAFKHGEVADLRS